jgi:integrase
VQLKRSADDDVSRLGKHVYPLLGPTPIDRVTLDDCERVMRSLPAKLAVATRRNVGQLITRIMTMAVYPQRLIERSPIASGFLPKNTKSKAFAYLYPDEDRQLLACTQVPLCYRVLWGFLVREGMREGEALARTWGDVDLERGAIRLDKNKTDDPRAWALDAGVVAALRAYRKHFRASSQPTDAVFVAPSGVPLRKSKRLPETLRSHLTTIGLAKERPELFVTDEHRQQFRVHDLRGTFVTVNLANGRSGTNHASAPHSCRLCASMVPGPRGGSRPQ